MSRSAVLVLAHVMSASAMTTSPKHAVEPPVSELKWEKLLEFKQDFEASNDGAEPNCWLVRICFIVGPLEWAPGMLTISSSI